MKVELWADEGRTYKITANKILLGLHTHPGDGKQYICVQVDDKEVYFLNTLVYVNDGTEFNREYPPFMDLPLEYQTDEEIKGLCNS